MIRNTHFTPTYSPFLSLSLISVCVWSIHQLPNLGNTSTKSASHISRVFEDWLQNKLYHQTNTDERLPILEDSVELLAEDIVNKLKSRNSVRGLTGLQQIYVQLRAGHVYSYNSLKEEGQPIITEDMQDFFQQFPLFIEITIYTIPRETIDYCYLDEDIQLLLSIENVTIDVTDPYYIMDSIQLIV